MFSFFKKKSEVEKLQKQYEKLLQEAYQLSHSNRRMADEKTAQAAQIMQQIEALQQQEREKS
ncbi:MAG: Lacal_2735 family protein [Cytophagales bacterium]|nr:MAG: Lacal_2735 family protein [Cytophagales bacterium]